MNITQEYQRAGHLEGVIALSFFSFSSDCFSFQILPPLSCGVFRVSKNMCWLLLRGVFIVWLYPTKKRKLLSISIRNSDFIFFPDIAGQICVQYILLSITYWIDQDQSKLTCKICKSSYKNEITSQKENKKIWGSSILNQPNI